MPVLQTLEGDLVVSVELGKLIDCRLILEATGFDKIVELIELRISAVSVKIRSIREPRRLVSRGALGSDAPAIRGMSSIRFITSRPLEAGNLWKAIHIPCN
jgi:hypothetical protein